MRNPIEIDLSQVSDALCTSHCQAPEGEGGGEEVGRHTQGDLTFLPIFMSNALPRGQIPLPWL